MSKRLFCFVVSLILVFAFFISGCGSKTDQTDGSKQDDKIGVDNSTSKDGLQGDQKDTKEEKPAGYSLPIVDPGSMTLSYAGFDSWTPQYSLADNREVWQAIEKDTGVKIKWEVLPGSDYTTSIKVRIAANELPDIMMVPSSINPIQLSRDGLTVDHTELIRKYAPNILKKIESNDMIRAAMVGPDGKIYSATTEVSETRTNVKRLYYRRDWIKELGLKEPETIEDYYDILKAFATQDPNGNGENDEVPIVSKGIHGFGTLAIAFDVYVAYSDGWHADENGKVMYDYIRPEFKDLLIFMNRLYQEDLLQKEVYVDAATEKTIISNNQAGMYSNGLGQCDAYDRLIEQAGVDLSEGGYYFAPPPVNKKTGERFFDPRPYVNTNRFVVTKKCKNPEVAIKWLDYVWATEEGSKYLTYGIEGKTYVINNEGKPEFTDYILDHPEGIGVHAALRTVGAFAPHITYWTDEAFAAQWVKNEKIAQIPVDAKPYFKKEPFPKVLGTPEEEKRVASIMADLGTYRDEMILKFIMGTEPLDNFDKYVATMRNMGVEELIEIKQQQYDRVYKSK